MKKILRLSLKTSKEPQTVEFQVAHSLLNTGFKFSFLAPVSLEEKILEILRSHRPQLRDQVKNDSLEEALLAIDDPKILWETAAYRFELENVA